MALIQSDLGPIRAVERETYALKEYLDGAHLPATFGLRPTTYFETVFGASE